MEYRIHSLHRRPRNARLAQVRLGEFDFSVGDVFLDVVAMPARQVIDDTDFRATCEKVIRQRRADEGGATRH
jgi:hypothetical protein